MRILLLLVLLAPLALPQEGTPITEAEIFERMREQARLYVKVRKNEMKPEDFLKTYAKVRAAPPRAAAIDHYLYGYALRLLERNAESDQQFRLAAERMPAFPPAILALSEVARAAGALAEAQRLADKALAFDPNYSAAWFQKGGIYRQEGRLPESLPCLRRALELEPRGLFCGAVVQCCLELRADTTIEKERETYAEEALRAAEAFVVLEPENGRAHMMLAEVFQRLERPDDSIRTLEEAQGANIPDESKVACLHQLWPLYLMKEDLAKVDAVYARMLAFDKVVAGKERERLEQMRKDLAKHSVDAPLKWRVEVLLDAVESEGLPVDRRRLALRDIRALYAGGFDLARPQLLSLHQEVFRRLVSLVVKAPAPILQDMLVFFRDFHRNPRILPIVVFFVYPNDDARRTPAVRVEGVRTIVQCAPEAAFPILLYCLQDDSPEVLRAVDLALVQVTQTRSPVGEGAGPVTPEERQALRKAWHRFAAGEEGAPLLARAIAELRKCVSMDEANTRDLKQAPLAMHVARICMDGDHPFATWKEAHAFLRDYMGKEFRPVERRGTPVEPSERAAIAKEIEDFFR